MFHTYVLYSKDYDKIYIGQTQNLEKRMISHNELGNGYTKRYRPWKVIHLEPFKTRPEALRREKELKSGQGRAWIRAVILQE